MPRIQPIDPAQCPPSVKVVLHRHIKEFGGHLDQTKASLAHSLPAFESYMGYCDLFRELTLLIGEKELLYYSHQVSIATESPVAIARFRKRLAELDIDPRT